MELSHELTGQGPPLVLISGCATDRTCWVFQVPEWSAHFRVLTFDNRGVGRSPCPAGPGSTEQMADDTAELLDSVGMESAVVLGHSMGGMIAQQLALRHPQRVRALILAGTMPRVGARCAHVLDSWTRSLELGVPPELHIRLILPWIFSPAFLADADKVRESVQAYLDNPWPQGAAANSAQVAAVLGHDTRARLREIQAPTLILQADQDLFVALSDSLALQEGIPGATLRVIPGGHACMLEEPAAFNQAVFEFLAATWG
ncbi:MAG: alpha/beta fold hydrolase [Candidatus Eremiobacterota bacterium]